MEHTANVLNPKGFRGFESLLLRKNNEPDARASGNYIFAGRRRDSKAGGAGPVSRRDAEAGVAFPAVQSGKQVQSFVEFLRVSARKNIPDRILPVP